MRREALLGKSLRKRVVRRNRSGRSIVCRCPEETSGAMPRLDGTAAPLGGDVRLRDLPAISRIWLAGSHTRHSRGTRHAKRPHTTFDIDRNCGRLAIFRRVAMSLLYAPPIAKPANTFCDRANLPCPT